MGDVRFIPDRLDKRMKELGYTDKTLAKKTGIGKTTIYYLRSGRKGQPASTSAENLAIIADTLSTSTQYFIDENADPSPNQKKMSAMVADIANVANGLSPSKQRQLREIGRALGKLEQSIDVEEIYSELVYLIGRLTEIDGGEKALDTLKRHVASLATGTPASPVKRRTRGRTRPKTGSESSEQPAQSEE